MKDKALRQFIVKSIAVTLLVTSISIALPISFELVNWSWWWVGFPLIGCYSFGVVAIAIHMANLVIGENYED